MSTQEREPPGWPDLALNTLSIIPILALHALIFNCFLTTASITQSPPVLFERKIRKHTENYNSISAFNLQDGSKIDLNKSVSSIFEERNESKEVEKSDSSNASINSVKEEIKNAINNLQSVDEVKFGKPLKKYEIQKIYSTDSVIYSKTLDMWKIHSGIDLKTDIDSDVYSVESGVVSKIYDDSFLGKTIVIEHNNGYKSAYSNLNENVKVNANDKVKKGQQIGTIGNTAIGEIKDEPHLHFAMYKDDESIDPSFIIYE